MVRLSTVAAFGFADFHPPTILALYRKLGCTTCQFYRNEKNPPHPEDVIKITSDAGLSVDSIHGVFGQQYDPSHPDDSERRAVVEIYRGEGELAAELGGPMVVVHPAPMAPPGHQITPAERQDRVDPLRRSVVELARMGERIGVTYLMENIPDAYWIGNDPLQLAAIVRETDSPHVRMCFDTGHAKMTGTVEDRLTGCADVVGYMHVHDNDGTVDDHRMPGDGAIDWDAVRKAIVSAKLDVPAMLEVFYLKDQLERLTKTDLPKKLAKWLNVAGAGAEKATKPPKPSAKAKR